MCKGIYNKNLRPNQQDSQPCVEESLLWLLTVVKRYPSLNLMKRLRMLAGGDAGYVIGHISFLAADKW